MQKWFDATSKDFIFSVKAWNLITHRRRLLNCEKDIYLFLENISILKKKIGVILFQLPVSFKKDINRLQNFIKLLHKKWKYAFELRNPEWHTEEICEVLSKYNIAFCIFEIANLISPRFITADFIYIRLHGRESKYTGKYDNSDLHELKKWLITQNKPAYIYFDNTMNNDDAIINAIQLNNMM